MPRPRRVSSPRIERRKAPERAASPPPITPRRVALHPHGLDLTPAAKKPSILPLYAGAMHYWRHDPAWWEAGLDGLKSMGLRLLDTYVPWSEHEIEAGIFDFGERNPQLDVARFLTLAHERDLKVVLRPGPHINAELTNFGLPERVVWDRACQARTPRDNPVMLPMLPVAFPVPSYASAIFHDEVERWFDAVGTRLSHLRHPEGPIVLVQVDNEGALYFRDGPYDQDYHPDAVALFRAFLRTKYKSARTLRDAWNDPDVAFATLLPPVRFDARTADDVSRHMDWMEFHEHLLASGIERMARSLAASGLGELPTMHNFPPGEAATPLNAARMAKGIDLIGLDYYHAASADDHLTIFRRTSELAARCEGRGVPPYAAEMGAGFPPFFAPLDEEDSLYALMTALAYGLRGFNLYMAVERDRWIGAPIDLHGLRRPLARKYEALSAALERTQFHTLKRSVRVRLVVPRSLRRQARATHAFGPLTPALFNVLGQGYRESCLEENFENAAVPAATIVGESYLRAFERALWARGVPFSYAGGESFDVSTTGAEWIICATPGGVKEDFVSSLRAASESGARVTIGPSLPQRDGSMRRMSKPHDTRGLELEPLEDLARADALVAKRIEELGLPTYPVDPQSTYVCVHEDDEGAPRVVMVMNPTAEEVVVKFALVGALCLEDLLARDPTTIDRAGGGFELSVPARTVRMLSVTQVVERARTYE